VEIERSSGVGLRDYDPVQLQFVERNPHRRLVNPDFELYLRGAGCQESPYRQGVALSLPTGRSMKLMRGEIVTILCPYTAGSQNVEQKAEVTIRLTLMEGTRWLYGFRCVGESALASSLFGTSLKIIPRVPPLPVEARNGRRGRDIPACFCCGSA
jgi:hypothetical protein